MNEINIKEYAKKVDEKSLICVFLEKGKWILEMVVDTFHEADEWWENFNGAARVYYGQTGAVRNAK